MGWEELPNDKVTVDDTTVNFLGSTKGIRDPQIIAAMKIAYNNKDPNSRLPRIDLILFSNGVIKVGAECKYYLEFKLLKKKLAEVGLPQQLFHIHDTPQQITLATMNRQLIGVFLKGLSLFQQDVAELAGPLSKLLYVDFVENPIIPSWNMYKELNPGHLHLYEQVFQNTNSEGIIGARLAFTKKEGKFVISLSFANSEVDIQKIHDALHSADIEIQPEECSLRSFPPCELKSHSIDRLIQFLQVIATTVQPDVHDLLPLVKQRMLDISLIHSVYDRSWRRAKELLELGADINCLEEGFASTDIIKAILSFPTEVIETFFERFFADLTSNLESKYRGFVCPLTEGLMLDPVHIPGEPNFSYDRQALAKPGRKTGSSPVTHNEFNIHELKPNSNLVLKMRDCLKREMGIIYRSRKPLVPGYLSKGRPNLKAQDDSPAPAPAPAPKPF